MATGSLRISAFACRRPSSPPWRRGLRSDSLRAPVSENVLLSFRETPEPRVNICGSVHLAASVYRPVGRQRFLDELAHSLFARGVTFDRFQHEAVRGTPALFRQRCDTRSELGRKLEGSSGSHVGSALRALR